MTEVHFVQKRRGTADRYRHTFLRVDDPAREGITRGPIARRLALWREEAKKLLEECGG